MREKPPFSNGNFRYNKNMEKIIPDIFYGYPVQAFFTKKIQIEKLKETLRFKVYMPLQKHTDKVLVINEDTNPEIADAVITNKKELFLGVKVADCLPVLIYDPVKKVVGAVHAGWRSTAQGIIKKTILKMIKFYDSLPENLLIAFGPNIKGCCYEVGDDVIEALKKETPSDEYILRVNGRKHVDLSIANFIQAITAGVKKENIWISNDCTYCKNKEYASYRFHKEKAGRQYGIIGLYPKIAD